MAASLLSSEKDFKDSRNVSKSTEETSVEMQLSKLQTEKTTTSNSVSEFDENTTNEKHIFVFHFETEDIEIDTKRFPPKDKEEVLKIIQWFKNHNEEKKLTLAEVKSLEKSQIDSNDEKQKYFRVLFEETEPEWAAVNENIIEKVLFLEAASSERWKQNGDVYSPVTITSVRASSLKLLNIFMPKDSHFIENWETMFSSTKTDLSMKSFIENINDLNFLGVLGVQNDEFLSSTGFNIVKTCNLIHLRDKEATTKLLLATHLGWFNGKILDLKTRDKVYNAFWYIVSNPGIFNYNFVTNTRELYGDFNFTKNQINRLHTFEFGVSKFGDFNGYQLFDNDDSDDCDSDD